MSDLTARVVTAVEKIIEQEKGIILNGKISENSSLNDPSEWDSLCFISVFLGICEAFSLSVDDDDAIHFTSIRSIVQFIHDVNQ